MKLLFRIAVIVALPWVVLVNETFAQLSEDFDAPPEDCSPYEQYYDVFPGHIEKLPPAEDMIKVATCLFATYPENRTGATTANFWIEYAIMEHESPEAMYILARWINDPEFRAAIELTALSPDYRLSYRKANSYLWQASYLGYAPAVRPYFELIKRTTGDHPMDHIFRGLGEQMRRAGVYYWLRWLRDNGELVDIALLNQIKQTINPTVFERFIEKTSMPPSAGVPLIALNPAWFDTPPNLAGYLESLTE
jgi:hypothetical protein